MTNNSDNSPRSDIDERLIQLLRENARMPVAEIARRLGLARTTVQAHIERLERRKIIVGYSARLSDAYQAGRIRAMVMIKVPTRYTAAAERLLRTIPEIRSLYSVSGAFDMVAVISAASVERLDEVIDQIGLMDGIESTMSSIILATKFDR